MRYAILVLLLASFASLHEHPTSQRSELMEQDTFPLVYQVSYGKNLTNLSLNVISSRPKRSAKELSLGLSKKVQRRKAKRLKLKRYLRKQLRKAENKRASLYRKGILDAKRQSREEDDSMLSHEVTQENQNELLASVDDLPKRSTTVEISVKDPGLCKVDGVPMCKHGGECMSRDEGGAPVFFCACQPAWGGDFCHERRDPCSAGLLDCGSMFRCRRDEHNRLAGFTCGCHERLGWTQRSESDPRCIRITYCSEGNPCENGGTCRQEEGGFVCVCTEHSSGDLCEHPVSADSPAAEIAGPAIARIAALLESGQSIDDISGLPQRRDTFLAGDHGSDGGAISADARGGTNTGYRSVVSANYAVSPPSENSDTWATDSDVMSADASEDTPAVDMRGAAARYGGIISARYGSPPATSGYNGNLERRAANTGAGWPGYGYYSALSAGQSDAVVSRSSGTTWAGYDRTPGVRYDVTDGRRRRSHELRSRRQSRRRRQHEKFLERLLQDVEPQIRRTARDSVIELPHR